MEAIINSKKLKEQVSALQGILARKATIPVLSTIKIDASERGDLIMTATDLDVSLIIEQETDVLRPGSICLNGRKLGDITATFPNEPIHLRLDDNGSRVEFRAGRFVSRLAGTESEQFPEVPRVAGEAVKIPAQIIYEGLRRTAFALTNDNSQFTLNAVLLVVEETNLKMVATDGHRLCYFRMMTTAGRGNAMQCLIPKKAAEELKGLLADEIKINSQTEVKIKKGSQLEFAVGSKTMTARELTGTFPNWEMVLPKTFAAFAEINVREFKEALTRVGVMADDKNRRVEFIFYPEKVVLKTESPETGSSVEEVGCAFQRLGDAINQSDQTSGDGSSVEWKIAFNTKYLTDFFSIHAAKREDGRIVWKFAGGNAQTEMMFEGEERLFSYVLVPLKA